MRENCTYSLSGGRWPARKCATSDPTPMNRPNKESQLSAEGGEGSPRIKENASPTHTSPTQSGEHVTQGLAGARQASFDASIQDKSRMREIRSYGSVRGASGDRCPYRDLSKPANPAAAPRPSRSSPPPP